MDFDIASKLQDWDYSPNDLNVRKIKVIDGKPKIQVRMDLGLLQMEWEGRPDGLRPNQKDSQLEYFRSKLRDSEIKNGPGSFSLTRDDCWLLAQEAMKFYWRRISFFELKEYALAERDARHNLSILDLCYDYAESEEDREMAEQHTPFVTAHCTQARALSHLDVEQHKKALVEIRGGITEIENFLRKIGRFDELENCPELHFLREWETEVESKRPVSEREKLSDQLRSAVENDQFELAADLRDRLRSLKSGNY
tara:strand:+ start:242 stop:1000 length:759 start_codon:yes stop_codon:yes gene_type:complete